MSDESLDAQVSRLLGGHPPEIHVKIRSVEQASSPAIVAVVHSQLHARPEG